MFWTYHNSFIASFVIYWVKKPTHISSKHSIFKHKEAVGHCSVPLGREDEILKSLLLFIDTRLRRSSR